MKVTLKESHSVVYQMITHQIRVDIDGTEFIIRQTEDDNGCDYSIYSPLSGNGWVSPYSLPDSELKEVLIKLSASAYDSSLFGGDSVGEELDLQLLNEEE